MNARRKFLFGLVALAATSARSQPAPSGGRLMRVAVLNFGTGENPRQERAFVGAMRDLGWVEGRNIVYERAYAARDAARLPGLSGEIVARKPDVIYTVPTSAALALYAKTRSIPIVFGAVVDPVGFGLVQGLARPGGNVTGVATLGWELGGKRMQLLQEALPKVRRVGVLLIPTPNSSRELRLIKEATGAGVIVVPKVVKENDDLAPALAFFEEHRIEALLSGHVARYMGERKRILAFTTRQRIPLVAHRSEIADDGALITYSSNLLEQIRRSAHLVDKVLKGMKPAEIPVEHPTKFELVINMKTAKALGITIPQSILAQADRVIE